MIEFCAATEGGGFFYVCRWGVSTRSNLSVVSRSVIFMFNIDGIALFAGGRIYPLSLRAVWDDKTTTVNQTEKVREKIFTMFVQDNFFGCT